jgi:predicted nucleotidyltransferase
MPTLIDERKIQEIVGRILGLTSPRRIILFGSAASGRMTRDSDLDLLVLADDPGDTRKHSVRLRQALGGLGVPVDVVVMAPARFEETKEVIGGIAYPANKYGKVIYEASG